MTTFTYADFAKTEGGRKAMNAFAAADANASSGVLAAVYSLLDNGATPDMAAPLLAELYQRAATLRVAGTSNIATPIACGPTRVSAFRSILKCRDFDCWPAFFGAMKPRNPGYETIVTLANWFRKSGIAKVGGTAPTTDAIVNYLQEASVARKAKSAKVEAVDKVRAAPAKTLDNVMAALAHLATCEPQIANRQFLTAALASCKAYAPIIGQRQADADAEAARKKTMAKYAAAPAPAPAPAPVKARKARGK
jgi:hypothetical protein